MQRVSGARLSSCELSSAVCIYGKGTMGSKRDLCLLATDTLSSYRKHISTSKQREVRSASYVFQV